jgi:acetolactate synthase regulatory subunit
VQTFQIRYRNTQGTLMRILNAASRRGLEITSVHAEEAENGYQVTLAFDVNPKQAGQLFREWYSIADVTVVRAGSAQTAAWAVPHPPAGVCIESRSVARA